MRGYPLRQLGIILIWFALLAWPLLELTLWAERESPFVQGQAVATDANSTVYLDALLRIRHSSRPARLELRQEGEILPMTIDWQTWPAETELRFALMPDRAGELELFAQWEDAQAGNPSLTLVLEPDTLAAREATFWAEENRIEANWELQW